MLSMSELSRRNTLKVGMLSVPPGEHTRVSRAVDVHGNVQSADEELGLKKTRWENNGQYVRKVMIV